MVIAISHDGWIAASNPLAFSKFGISGSAATISRGLETLHAQLIARERRFGATEETARSIANQKIRYAPNQVGKETWHIHRNHIQLLKDWVEQEREWIIVSNTPARYALGIHSESEIVNIAIARLVRNAKQEALLNGSDEFGADAFAEERGFRFGRTLYIEKMGWQFLPKAAPLLKRELSWVNTKTKEFFKEHGFKEIREASELLEANALLNEHYESLVNDAMKIQHLTKPQAELQISTTKLRRAHTVVNSSESWEVQPDYTPELRRALPALRAHTKEWLTMHQRELGQEVGIYDPTNLTKFITRLRDKKTKEFIDQGMSPSQAALEISEHWVWQALGTDKPHIFYIHRDAIPALKEVIQFEKDWIPLLNPNRLYKAGMHGKLENIEQGAWILQRRKINEFKRENMSQEQAEAKVAEAWIRKITKKDGKTIQEVHRSAIDELNAVTASLPGVVTSKWKNWPPNKESQDKSR